MDRQLTPVVGLVCLLLCSNTVLLLWAAILPAECVIIPAGCSSSVLMFCLMFVGRAISRMHLCPPTHVAIVRSYNKQLAMPGV